jgi:hypothetical protein
MIADGAAKQSKNEALHVKPGKSHANHQVTKSTKEERDLLSVFAVVRQLTGPRLAFRS